MMVPWVHPLTPYRYDPQKKNFLFPSKVKKEDLDTDIGLAWLCKMQKWVIRPQLLFKFFNDERGQSLFKSRLSYRLWCFGYDMDNMKARCWYDHIFPFFHLMKDKELILLIGLGN